MRQRTAALWLFRACVVLGLFIIPSLAPMTCVHAALDRHDSAHQRQITALEQRISQLERRLAAQAIRPVEGQSKTQPKSPKRMQEQRRRATACARRKLPEVSAPLDPLATRIHRRLALVRP